MKILFLTSGRRAPSSRFRVLQLVPHLRRLGHRCVVWPSHPPKYESYRWLGWRPSQKLRRWLRYVDVVRARLNRFDVICLERELFDDGTWNVEACFRRTAPAMCLDVDDGVFLRHPEKFAAVAKMCDGVIAGSRLLRERILEFNSNAHLIPTVVDLDRYTPRSFSTPNSPPVIGWTGSSSNIELLGLIAEPLRRLSRTIAFQLRVIADDPGPLEQLNLEGIDVRFVRWCPRTEIADLQTFDIGLMPLADDEWTRYKCGLKIIQYQAIAIPAVASPVGANCDIIRSGENGFLSASADEWFETLRRLIHNPELRKHVGNSGRQTVEQHYSVQAQLPAWLTFAESLPRC